MQRLKFLSTQRAVNPKSNVLKCVRQTQTKAVQKLVLTDTDSYPITPITKKPAKPPFLKNLFIGNYDVEMLYFPEPADTDRYLALESILPRAEEFFKTQVDSRQIDKDGHLSEALITGLKDLGLFGNSLPSSAGGLDHSYTEHARLIEAASAYPPISLMLIAHQTFAAKALLRHGNQHLISKYIESMAAGDSIAGFCMAEPEAGMDFSAMTSLAELSKDGTYYVLNGTKSWVINAPQADYFIVAAATEVNALRRKLNNALTVFIVDKSSQGIFVQPREETLGGKGINVCEIKFQEVKIPVGNIVGEAGKGFDVCCDVLHTEAYLHGSIAAGTVMFKIDNAAGFLKKLFAETVKYIININQYGRSLIEINSVQKKVAEMSTKIYAVESMTYLTASILDQYEEPDCELESLVTKMYASITVQSVVQDCLELLGSKGNLLNFPYEQYLRDSLMSPFFNVSLDFTDIYVAATGLNFAGSHLQDFATKLRNPLYHPVTAFKIFFETQKNLTSEPKLTLHLDEYVHPALKEVVKVLERAALRFKFSVLMALTHDGQKITENHILLKRLSEFLMLIYAMNATIGRASRAYCCGTRNGDHEILLAEVFVRNTMERIDKLAIEINKGPVATTDVVVTKIADIIFQYKGHATEHPLQRNII